jgi:hypothetical protein
MLSAGTERENEVRKQPAGSGRGKEMKKDVKIEGTDSRIC